MINEVTHATMRWMGFTFLSISIFTNFGKNFECIDVVAILCIFSSSSDDNVSDSEETVDRDSPPPLLSPILNLFDHSQNSDDEIG